MCKLNKKSGLTRIDPCISRFTTNLQNSLRSNIEVVASCCGHGKYPMTIIVKYNKKEVYDLVSGVYIPRKKRFYKKDKKGFYYIPETIKGEGK